MKSLFHMIRRFAKGRSTYLALGIVVLLIIGGIVIWQQRSEQEETTSVSETSFVSDEAYQGKVKTLYAQLSDPANRKAKETKEELLTLKVQKEFKDLHLKMVMASATLEDYDSFHNPAVLARGEVLLKELAKDYPWLADSTK